MTDPGLTVCEVGVVSLRGVVVRFIGGTAQQQYVEKTRALEASRCLVAGIDVGKYEALCLIADHRGELVGQPLTFRLTQAGAARSSGSWQRLFSSGRRCRCVSGSRLPGTTTARSCPVW